MRSYLAILGAITLLGSGPSALSAAAPKDRAPATTTDYAMGADISSVTEVEKSGITYRDARGEKADLYDLVKGYGINAIRLRVWVDPAGGWSGAEDVLVKARRAQSHGQKIMIDFHYSDNWADPGKQPKPAAWTSYSVDQLKTAVADHTRETLSLLKENGIAVTWVQVGNEITNGLLWPEGKTDDFAKLAAFTNAGYDAVKAVYPDAAVIIHIDNGWDTAKARWWFDSFAAQGGKVDIIGLSFYPEFTPSKNWRTETPKVSATMTDLVAQFHKPVMIVETGYRYDQPTEARAMIRDLIAGNRALGKMGLGTFYWEPGTPVSSDGYKLGATDDNNRLTKAMEAFRP